MHHDILNDPKPVFCHAVRLSHKKTKRQITEARLERVCKGTGLSFVVTNLGLPFLVGVIYGIRPGRDLRERVRKAFPNAIMLSDRVYEIIEMRARKEIASLQTDVP